jgi:hypothetical protein
MAVSTRSKTTKTKKTLKKCRSAAYKKHGKMSECSKIKRSAVCKRSIRCKQAKGTKRSFCRTKTNRKSGCKKN